MSYRQAARDITCQHEAPMDPDYLLEVARMGGIGRPYRYQCERRQHGPELDHIALANTPRVFAWTNEDEHVAERIAQRVWQERGE